MSGFKSTQVVAEDWAHVAQACVEGLLPPGRANLGFLYVTDTLAGDLSSILTYLRQRTGIEHWVGSVGVGVCAGTEEYADVAAAAAMLGEFPLDSFRLFPSLAHGPQEWEEDLISWISARRPYFGLVHGDPHNPEVPNMVEAVAQASGAFLVGGITTSRAACHQIAGRVTGGGLSGALFAPEVAVATGLAQGCMPLGEPHVISDAIDNVVVGIDGRRALDALLGDLGIMSLDDPHSLAGRVHVAFPVEGSDVGDYTVRGLVGIDPMRGWLAVDALASPGERMLFVRRDPRAARDDLESMLLRLRRRLDRPPRGGIYISCVGRGAHMFGAPGVEMAHVRRLLGPVPVIGFQAGGEISGGRLHGYTGVLSLFL